MNSEKNLKWGKNILLLCGAQFISDLGNWFYTIAISASVYMLTKSSLALSSVIITSLIPSAVFSIIGGGISDKYNPKKLMILTDIIRCITVLFALLFNSIDRLYIVLLISLVNSTCGSLFTTSRYVVIQRLLKGDALNKAISNLRVLYELTVILGSALGGTALALLGFKYVIYFDSLTFALSALFIGLTKYQYSLDSGVAKDRAANNFLKAQKEGYKYIFKNLTLTNLMIYKTFYTISGGILNILPAILAIKIFNFGQSGIGYIFSAIGIGSIIGAFLVGKLKELDFKKSYLLYGGIVLCIGWVFLGLAGNFYYALAAICIICTANIFSHTYIESHSIIGVEEQFIGRVSGVFQFITYIALVISLTVLAKLIDYNFQLALLTCILLICIPNALLYLKALFEKSSKKEEQSTC